MNAEIDKNMAILMGKNTQNKSPELTADEKQKMADAYSDLFFGLAGANWARGTTLGAAWYAALQQIDGMMGAKNKNNPAAMYLNQAHVAHRAKWSQAIMTHPNKDQKMDMSDTTKQKWSGERAKQIGNAMAVINAFIQSYQMQMTTPQQVTPIKINQTKAMIFMMAKQNINMK